MNPKVIRVQETRRKWGSCSSAGTVTLASDLAVQEQRFQDYVIVHELLHLRLSTHGRVFKALMSAHVPGWQTMDKRRMKDHERCPPDDRVKAKGAAPKSVMGGGKELWHVVVEL